MGIHPHEYNQLSPTELSTTIEQHNNSLSKMLNNENIIAIGETGLDYYRLKEEEKELALHNQKNSIKNAYPISQ